MNKLLEELGIAKNQPLYVYQQPMFDLRVSVVLIEDNGVIVMETGDGYHFPGGKVRASQETIQFSAVRQIKEQTGIALKKDALIPVDFRSSPERSPEGNVVDIGMVCILQNSFESSGNARWLEVNFEKKCFADDSYKLDNDHDVLLQRALEVALMMKE
jgi:ADP-ribose pyrophosphatase YjhB (NUDIX family)